MAETRHQVFVYPARRAAELLSVLREIEDHVDALASLIRLQWYGGDKFRFVLTFKRGRDVENGRVALRDALKLEYSPQVNDLDSLQDSLTIREGLAAMLYSSSRVYVSESEQLKPTQHEVLYLVQDSDDQLEFLGDAVQLQATASSSRIYTLPGQEDLGVYRLVDDHERDSVAQVLHDAGLLKSARMFDVFASPAGTIYLPHDEEHPCRPPARAVEDFLSVVQRKVLSSELGSSVDWMIADHVKNNRLTVYALAPLGEHDPQQAIPFFVEILELSDSAIDPEELQEASDVMGYRLELRPSFSRDASHRDQSYVREELGRIQEEILALEAKYDFLMTSDDCWPMLYRFRQDQLSALVCALRSFPVKDLESGRVKYAFSASEAHAEGAHYVYFEPDSTMMTNDFPEIYWDQHLGPQPYVFTYDPFWASHYAKNSRSKVFVPKGAAIFPPLHSWNLEGMDGYLGRIMKIYFEEGRLPEQPLYIFDQAAGRDDRVAVHVLEFEKFSRFPEQIGWLNDGLQFLDVRRDVQDRVEEIARLSRDLEAIEKFDYPPERSTDPIDQVVENLSERIRGARERVEKQLGKLDVDTRAAAEEVLVSLTRIMNATAEQAKEAKSYSEGMLERLNSAISLFNFQHSEIDTVIQRSAEEIEHERGKLDGIEEKTQKAGQSVRDLEMAIDSIRKRIIRVDQIVTQSTQRKEVVVKQLKELKRSLNLILRQLG